MHKRTSSAASRSNIPLPLPLPPTDPNLLSTPPRTTALMPGHHRHAYSHPYTPDVSLFPSIPQQSPPASPSSKSLSPLPTTTSDPFYLSPAPSKTRFPSLTSPSITGLGITLGGLSLHLPRSLSATPTKRMRRLTLLAFFALLAISAYTILLVPNSVSRTAPRVSSKHKHNKYKYDPNSSVWRTRIRPHVKAQTQAHGDGEDAVEPTRAPYAANKHSQAQDHLRLSPEQELAALASFMTALSTNALPPTTSPSDPIDPQLILDFDFTRPHVPARGGSSSNNDENVDSDPEMREDWVMRELAVMAQDVWHRHPIVLFGSSVGLKARVTRELTMLLEDTLEEMNVKSGAVKKGKKKKGKQTEDVTLFVVDQRADAHVLTPTLLRLTGAQSLPILLIGGQPIGVDLFQTDSESDSDSTSDEVKEVEGEGEEEKSDENPDRSANTEEHVVDEDPATSVLRTVRALNQDGELVRMIHEAMGPRTRAIERLGKRRVGGW